jgi:molecular chaperone DnaK
MTVVAAGAAIFAGTQRMPSGVGAGPGGSATKGTVPGAYSIQLEYQPVGADTDPLVGGKVAAPEGQSLSGFTVEFIDADARPPRRSGKLPLSPDGTFLTNLWAEPGRLNTYLIELCDAAGRVCPTSPDRLTYRLGNAPTDPPLIHSLGVAMASNEMDTLIPKGTALPARKRVVHRTARLLRHGQAEDVLRIPVVEGENVRRADRNRLIGTLQISAEAVKRDVPAGSEVEITIEIDTSRLLRTRAYVPVLDEEFEDVLKFNRTEASPQRLRTEAECERRRLQEVRRKADDICDAKAFAVLARIDEEHMEQDLEAALDAADADPDAADKAQNRLLDLKSAIDEADDALEWPLLVGQADDKLSELRQLTEEHSTPGRKQLLAQMERETRAAVQSRDVAVLRRKTKQLGSAVFQINRELPSYWKGWLLHLELLRGTMRDPQQSQQLFDRAAKADADNDLPALRAAVQQLWGLLPESPAELVGGFGGTTVR